MYTSTFFKWIIRHENEKKWVKILKMYRISVFFHWLSLNECGLYTQFNVDKYGQPLIYDTHTNLTDFNHWYVVTLVDDLLCTIRPTIWPLMSVRLKDLLHRMYFVFLVSLHVIDWWNLFTQIVTIKGSWIITF